MFIALANDPKKENAGRFIQSVTYHLHPTFKPSVIKVSEPPFLISRIGWGYFEIHMEIVFKEWTGLPKMELDHMLSFDDNGKQEAFIVELEREEPVEEPKRKLSPYEQDAIEIARKRMKGIKINAKDYESEWMNNTSIVNSTGNTKKYIGFI